MVMQFKTHLDACRGLMHPDTLAVKYPEDGKRWFRILIATSEKFLVLCLIT